MKSFLIALLFSSTLVFAQTPAKPQTPKEIATAQLIRSYNLFHAQEFDAAARVDLEVIKTKGLPDEIYSAAFILMGNIALSAGRFDVADSAYSQVLKLAKAPAKDKKTAQSGLLLSGDLRKDQKRRQGTPQDFR